MLSKEKLNAASEMAINLGNSERYIRLSESIIEGLKRDILNLPLSKEQVEANEDDIEFRESVLKFQKEIK